MNLPFDPSEVLGSPSGASDLVRVNLDAKGLSASSAAKLIDVNQSTLSRFLSGSHLTVEMAAKLYKGLGLDIDLLFQLEANRNAFEAKKLIKK